MPSRIEIHGVEVRSPVANAVIRMVVLPVALLFVAMVLLFALAEVPAERSVEWLFIAVVVLLLPLAFVGIVLALAMGLILVAVAAATPIMLVERRRRQKQLPAPDSDESSHG